MGQRRVYGQPSAGETPKRPEILSEMTEETFPASTKGRLLALPSLMLIAANLIPLFGVVAWGWSVFEVVVLYWFENVILGVINILKMLTSAPTVKSDKFSANEQTGIAAIHHGSKLFFVPFFTVHYGLFTVVHGIFVFSLLGNRDGHMSAPGGPFAAMPSMVRDVLEGPTMWAALALVVSHGISFLYHFFFKGEFRRVNVPQLMFAPYGRVIVLHIAILGGAFAIQALGSPVFLLIILVIGKIAIDLGLHIRSHRKVEEAARN